jgi:phosphoserine phosphatase RsbU/P
LYPSSSHAGWKDVGFRVYAERRAEGGAEGGGDFYTVAVRGPGRIGVVIGDACGRGPDGEAQLSRILPMAHQLAISGASPKELLTELNRTVAAELPVDRFVTAAAFELDIPARLLTVANAAHVPGILRRARGRCVSVVGRPSGIPLGIAPRTTYAEEYHELERGDVVVLMTDGLLEAVEADLLSMSTLMRLLGEAPDGAADIYRSLLGRCDEANKGRRADDLTLVALEATPEPVSRRLRKLRRAGIERCAYLS